MMNGMNIELGPHEQLIKHGQANHYLRHFLMIGHLAITNQRLYFMTHPLNFRHYDLSIPLQDIARVELKNNIRIFPYGMYVHLRGGERHHFAVWRRRLWKQAVEQAKASVPTPGLSDPTVTSA